MSNQVAVVEDTAAFSLNIQDNASFSKNSIKIETEEPAQSKQLIQKNATKITSKFKIEALTKHALTRKLSQSINEEHILSKSKKQKFKQIKYHTPKNSSKTSLISLYKQNSLEFVQVKNKSSKKYKEFMNFSTACKELRNTDYLEIITQNSLNKFEDTYQSPIIQQQNTE